MNKKIKNYDPINAGFDNLGNGLIFTKSQNENEEPYTTDIAIANATGFSKNYVDRKIRTHYERLSKLNKKGIEISFFKSDKGGRRLKVYKLNRKQAIALCNTFDNSEFILDFKFKLADAFINAIDLLSERKLTHNSYKPNVAELGKAIKDNLHPAPRSHVYQHFNNLPYILLFGMNAKKLRAVRGYKANEDVLSCISKKEHEEVNRVRTAITNLVNLGFEYQEIKAFLSSKVVKLPITTKGGQ